MKDLYSENYETLIKESEDVTKKWKDIPFSWIGGINIIKMSILPKAIYRSNAINTHDIFHRTRTNNPKIYMKPQKTLNCQRILRKKNKAGNIMLPDFGLHVTKLRNQNSMILAQKQIHRSMEQNREPRNKPTHRWSINLQQWRQEYTVDKRQSL